MTTPKPTSFPRGSCIAIVTASWYEEVTSFMLERARSYLGEKWAPRTKIHWVPGCFELPLAAQWLAADKQVLAVIALGCVIRGETPHFEHVCRAATDGLLQTGLRYDKPVGYGLITANTMDQAKRRSKSKAAEATEAVLKMLSFKLEMTTKAER